MSATDKNAPRRIVGRPGEKSVHEIHDGNAWVPDPPAPRPARLDLEREIGIAKAEIHAVNTHAQLEQAVEELMSLAYALGLTAADQRVLTIAGLVNAYHNDGTTLSAAETLKAIADVLGPPMAADQRVTPAERKEERQSQDARRDRQPLAEHGDLPRPSPVVSERGSPEKA
jgi:hypothetical protein